MTPKEAIEKAVEGGWTCKGEIDGKGLGTPTWKFQKSSVLTINKIIIGFGGDPVRMSVGVDVHEIALDPTFWQALGKALGWDKLADGRNWEASKYGYMEVWRHHAHRFYDLILTGELIDKFWADLLAN